MIWSGKAVVVRRVVFENGVFCSGKVWIGSAVKAGFGFAWSGMLSFGGLWQSW